MTLAERVARRIEKMPRLAAIPPAVIKDVLAHGLQTLADMVPMETKAAELTSIDFDACGGCGHLIDPKNPEGAELGGEDLIWLCDACITEGGGVAEEREALEARDGEAASAYRTAAEPQPKDGTGP